MENHADILQQWIEVAAINGVLRQAAAERIGGEEDKQQETKGDHPHHRQHPGDGVERHPAAEDGDGEGPDAEQQDPQQQRALVRPPGRRHPIPHRQRAVRVFRHVADGKVIDHEGVHQQQEGAADTGEQPTGQRPGQGHQPPVLPRRAPQGIDAQEQRQPRRQTQ